MTQHVASTAAAAPLWRRIALAAIATALFVFAWLYRFNDPGGSFAGLTDDHFFYLVRGWQILFGDLPVRDFVDHGAPLFYYVGAAIQRFVERGTLSEIEFCVTVLALGAVATFLLGARASGSVVLGLVAALWHIGLLPRFYNYPKVIVYAAAIPLLWALADRQTWTRRFAVAVVTATGFLFRHDHGVFVAIAAVVLLLMLTRLSWRARFREVAIYAGLSFALVAPYLVFIQANEGLAAYVRDSRDWADKDRSRAPVVWPGLFDNPDGVSDAAKTSGGVTHAIAVMRDNMTAWTYYVEIYLPILALAVLALSRDAFRPGWPHATAKMTAVAVLALVLDAGFLRSPLAARLADPSVPLAVLLAWLAAACIQAFRRPAGLRIPAPAAMAAAVVVAAASLPVFVPIAAAMTHDVYRRLDRAALVDRVGKPFERALLVRDRLRQDWDLSTWETRPERSDLITLSMYLSECTRPGDHIFVQPYIPQVVALARRPFAGGHADLRPGFFDAVEAQTRTIERLNRQSVPLAVFESGDEYQNFRKAFPLVARYFDERYSLAGRHTFDRRFDLQLFARNDLVSVGPSRFLDWPCWR